MEIIRDWLLVVEWFVMLSDSDVVFCDVDGTLVDNSLDDRFGKMFVSEGRDMAVDWYDNECWEQGLVVNKRVVVLLVMLWLVGVELVLWTDRGECQRDMTENNVKWWLWLFDSSEYWESKKSRDEVVERYVGSGEVVRVVDNKSKYASEKGDVLV
tara:strand:+ start:352 stop:816 length:465 start_codon:yes stop_codon:yes gene_type:complete